MFKKGILEALTHDQSSSTTPCRFIAQMMWQTLLPYMQRQGTLNVGDDDFFAPLEEFELVELPSCKKLYDKLAATDNRLSPQGANRLSSARSLISALFIRSYSQGLEAFAKDIANMRQVSYDDDCITATRLRILKKDFNMTDAERDAVLIGSYFTTCSTMSDRIRLTNPAGKLLHGWLMDAFGHSSNDVAQVRSGALAQSGLLRCDMEIIRAAYMVNRYLCGSGSDSLFNAFVEDAQEPKLKLSSFSQVPEEAVALACRLLKSHDGTEPTNILLYGAPGTGKSTFALALSASCKRELSTIKQSPDVSMKESLAEDDRDDPDRYSPRSSTMDPNFRFTAYKLAQMFLSKDKDILLIDEADHMLSSVEEMFGRSYTSLDAKSGLVDCFEQSKIPTIWIVNCSPRQIHPAVLRRFNYSIEFPPLNKEQRKMIWKSCAKEAKVKIPAKSLNAFAEKYSVAAGVAATVLGNVHRLNDDVTLVDKFLKQYCRLTGSGEVSDKMVPAKDYSLEGLNIKSSIPLDRISTAVNNFLSGEFTGVDRPRMNILLSGPPGSGKTEFVKYLANKVNKEVLVRMGSDLLDKYVGGTEHNIAEAFAHAEESGSILFLDEIDGMLRSRGLSEHSWEVTQVNELLNKMENFNGVMIGATNFIKNLDPAVVRRFTFKVEFGYLAEDGKKLFFERMLKQRLTEEQERWLCSIPRLTPGDFRTVRQSFFYLQNEATVDDLLEALEQESKAKLEQVEEDTTRIGFGQL